jgi:hypothetical protein
MGRMKMFAGVIVHLIGLFLLLCIMPFFMKFGFFGTIFAFIFVIPLFIWFVHSPATKLVNQGRKELAGQAQDRSDR